MATPEENEIRGDWSNLKGTEYHFVYLLRALLKGDDHSISFYRGNDLLVQITPPPLISEETKAAVPIRLKADGEDCWVQLKATDDRWRISDLLEDNLLANFICNALYSEERNRTWRVRLISQGAINSTELKEFVAEPTSRPNHYSHLVKVITELNERLQKITNETPPDSKQLLALALKVLAQVAENPAPTRLETLKAEVEAEIAYRYPNRVTTRRIAEAWIGALLSDAAGGPTTAVPYTRHWLAERAGLPFAFDERFENDPVSVCSDAVKRVLPSNWDPNIAVQRVDLENVFRIFLRSRKALFILLGRSGVGKSWAVADLAMRALSDRIRLLIPGSDLDHVHDLGALVERRVGAFTERPLYIKHLRAAAMRETGETPPVILVDDLRVSSGPEEVYRRDIGRLVQQAEESGVKLVLVCQEAFWRAQRLSAEIPARSLYAIESEKVEARITYSYLLTEFSLVELEEAFQRRLAHSSRAEVLTQLRAPEFSILRTPYFLDLYLQQHSAGIRHDDRLPLPNERILLERRVDDYLANVAQSLGCEDDDAKTALRALVEQLWLARPNGLTFAQATKAMDGDMAGGGRDAVLALKRFGFLTSEGDLRIAEPSVADLLFAEHLLTQESNASQATIHLRPGQDDGVAVTLIRDAADPIPIAEALLRLSDDWISAVCNGLSRTDPEDLRVLAYLTAVSRPRDGIRVLEPAACEALGRLASRGKRAWKWVASMFLSDHPFECCRGENALGRLVEYAPKRVEAATRLRLSRSAARLRSFDHEITFERLDRRKLRLSEALSPFARISHRGAAGSGRRLIHRYESLTEGDVSIDWSFVETWERIRGLIAVLTPESGQMDALAEELDSSDRIVRLRAATAFHAVVSHAAPFAKDRLLQVIRTEQDGHVMNRLLWMAHAYLDIAPSALLDAISESMTAKWEQPLLTSGLTLNLLAELAGSLSIQVSQLLPSALPNYPPWVRAFLAEILAWAWWRLAEHDETARSTLDDMARISIDEIPEEFRPLAIRGAITAKLGLLCLDLEIPTDSLTGRQGFYPGHDLGFLYLDTVDFIRDYAARILDHPDSPQLVKLLHQCIDEEASVLVSPLQQGLVDARFRCSVLSLEAIISFAVHEEDVVAMINALPHDWQALRVAWRLFDLGRNDESLMDCVRSLCNEVAKRGTVQARHERNECLARLSEQVMPPQEALDDFQSSVERSPFEIDGIGLARLGEQHEGELLSLLDRSIRSERDLPTLFNWEHEARSWKSVLISRAYARMFRPQRILWEEACELCRGIRISVEALPDSRERDEYLSLYQSLENFMSGNMRPFDPPSSEESPIRRSHILAIEILKEAAQRSGSMSDDEWIRNFLLNRDGWWETTEFKCEGGSMSIGIGLYCIYAFPAVRLALIAAGRSANIVDPMGDWMIERIQVGRLLTRFGWAFTNMNGGDLTIAVNSFRDQAAKTPRDERLWRNLGNLLLRTGDLDGAQNALDHCLSLPTCGTDTRPSALYDLGCVYARLGNEPDCRSAIQESDRIRPVNRQWLQEDTDLESVRESPWFIELLDQPSEI